MTAKRRIETVRTTASLRAVGVGGVTGAVGGEVGAITGAGGGVKPVPFNTTA